MGGGFLILLKRRKVRRHDLDEAAERITEQLFTKRGIKKNLRKT